jgi:hypothetical protein
MITILVYSILFAAICCSLFMVLKNIMKLQNAFLAAVAGTILSVWILYGIREGVDFEVKAVDINSLGKINLKPTARPSDEIQLDIKRFNIIEMAVDGYIRPVP